MEKNLYQELDMLRTAVEALTHPFYLIDARTYNVLQGNSASGFKNGKEIKCYQLTHHRDLPCQGDDHPCPVDIVKHTGRPTQVEHIHYGSEGKPRQIEISAYPVKNDHGEVVQIIEMCQDKTEQRKAEKFQAKFRMAMDSSADSIYIIEYPSYRFVDVNETACRKLDYTRQELLKMRPFDIKPYFSEEELKQKFEQVLHCTVNGQKEKSKKSTYTGENPGDQCVEVFETYHRAKDGMEYPVEVTLRLANIPDEILFVASVRDMTRHKQDEAKLAEHAAELERKNKEVKRLYKKLEEKVQKAKRVHERTLPSSFPHVEGLTMAAYYQAAEELGGDFYNVIKTDSQLLFYLSDVTGHFMDSAIVCAFIKEVIDSYVSLSRGKLSPGSILNYLAKRYRQGNYPDEYCISIFLAVLDLSTLKLTYTGAGYHIEPLLGSIKGESAKISSEGLPLCNTVPISMMDFSEQEVYLKAGDTLFLYTDGLYEQKVGGTPYNGRISKAFFDHFHLPAEVVVNAVNEDFAIFNRNQFQADDDITTLALKIDPEDKFTVRWDLESSQRGLEKVKHEIFSAVAPYLVEKASFQSIYEMVVNAMEHGNYFDASLTVCVELIIMKDYLVVAVQDEGEGFDWLKQKQAFNKISDHWHERGRGIIISKQVSKGLYYNQAGNKSFLVLEKREQ